MPKRKIRVSDVTHIQTTPGDQPRELRLYCADDDGPVTIVFDTSASRSLIDLLHSHLARWRK